MSKQSNSQASGGIGFFGVLCIVFIVLKLTGNIAWSWWWVLSPLWLPITIILVLVVLYVTISTAFGK